MTSQRIRPSRAGTTEASGGSGRRTNTDRGRVSMGGPRVPVARHSDVASAAAAAREFPVDGSLALAVLPDELEPVRRRSAEEREAADARAAQRAADRAAGRAVAESRRRLRVAPPLPVTVARAPFVAMLLIIVVAGVVGILVLSTLINANQFQLNDLQNKQSGLNQQEQQLQQNLAQQQAPGSVVNDARRLGLVPAGTLGYIQMPDGSVVGIPDPAAQSPSVTAETNQSGTSNGAAQSSQSGKASTTRKSSGSAGH
jgi:hypothetical protein